MCLKHANRQHTTRDKHQKQIIVIKQWYMWPPAPPPSCCFSLAISSECSRGQARLRHWNQEVTWTHMTTISTGNTWLVFKVHEATPFSSSLTWVSAPSPKGRKLLFLLPIQLLIKNIDKNRHHGNPVLCAYVGFVFWIKKSIKIWYQSGWYKI